MTKTQPEATTADPDFVVEDEKTQPEHEHLDDLVQVASVRSGKKLFIPRRWLKRPGWEGAYRELASQRRAKSPASPSEVKEDPTEPSGDGTPARATPARAVADDADVDGDTSNTKDEPST